MKARAKIPASAEQELDALRRARLQLEAVHVRRLDVAIRALRAAVAEAFLTAGARRSDWTIEAHTAVMRPLRAIGRAFGSELTRAALKAALEAMQLGIAQQPRALAIVASGALERRVSAPPIDVHAVEQAAALAVNARAHDVGARAGESIAQAGVGASLIATRREDRSVSSVAAAVVGAMALRARRDSELVLTTEVVAGANLGGDAVLRSWAQSYPRMRRVWDATLDLRVCAMCESLHHVIVDVGEPWDGGVDDAPAHPRCRCATMGWCEDFTAALDALNIAPGPRTGVVGSIETQLPSFATLLT